MTHDDISYHMSLVSTPTMNDVDPIAAPSTGAATGAVVGTANGHATDATKKPSTTSVVDGKEGGGGGVIVPAAAGLFAGLFTA